MTGWLASLRRRSNSVPVGAYVGALEGSVHAAALGLLVGLFLFVAQSAPLRGIDDEDREASPLYGP